MKQRATRILFDYWDTLRGARRAPSRADIDPGAIRSCLANTFVLTFDTAMGHPFRIAGTAICSWFGLELNRTSFDELWAPEQRNMVLELIDTVMTDLEGLSARVTGRNADGDTVDFEMILLPLTGADGGTGRVLGALTPVSPPPYWVGTRPLQTLSLRKIGAVGDSENAEIAQRRFKIMTNRCISRHFHG
jgi:hypothetical protein